jgi:hypothetical protein
MNPDLNRMIELELPLIRLRPNSKIASEKWRDTEHRHRSPSYFVNRNYAVKCGTSLGEGFYLVVLDVDPRNGGNETLTGLQVAYGSLPPTLRVKTGSEGQHWYFKSKKLLPKCRIGKGLDLQGQGSYVVGPGSTHESGNLYSIIDDTEIEEIPDWLVDMIPANTELSEKPFFDGATIKDRNQGKFPKGQRNDLMTATAGALRRQGLSAPAIFAALLEINKERCEPPLPQKELSTIANSIAKYEPEDDLFDSPPKLELVKEQEPERPIFEPTKTETDIQKRFVEGYQMSDGLVRAIADTILDNAPRTYEHFAIASALGIISVAAQGAFNAPSLGEVDDKGGSSLSLYQWLTAPAAAGKDHYRRCVDAYIRSIDERLVCPKVGSFYGLRSSLYAFNSSVQIIDEMQDELTRLSSSSSYLSQILTEMKELTNNISRLEPIVIKDKIYPGIERPRFSVFGLGTVGGFVSHLNSALIGGGLLSRFLVWPQFPVPAHSFGKMFNSPPRHEVEYLQDIFKTGLTFAAKEQDYFVQLQEFHGIDEKGKRKNAPPHEPQNAPGRKVITGVEGKEILISFYRQQEKRYQALVKSGLADSDLSPGSIIARSPQNALKLATLHAIGCGHLDMTKQDADFGVFMASVLCDAMTELVTDNASDSHYQGNVNRIMKVVKRIASEEAKSIREILMYSKLPRKDVEPILIDLSLSGKIYVVNKDGEPVDMEGQAKIKRGMKVVLR